MRSHMLRRLVAVLSLSLLVWAGGRRSVLPTPLSPVHSSSLTKPTSRVCSPSRLTGCGSPCPAPTSTRKSLCSKKRTPTSPARLASRSTVNSFYYIEGPANEKGEAHFKATYRVRRNEVTGPSRIPSPIESQMYLQPEQLVPIGGKPLTLIKDKKLPADPMKKARAALRRRSTTT